MNDLLISVRVCATALILSCLYAKSALAAEPTLSGDLGAGLSWSNSQILGERNQTSPVPYLNLEYGPAFARIDTFGVKLLPIAYGHIEIIGQYRADGYKAPALDERRDSVPLGLGTLQVTPIGAFNINVLHDFGKSAGTLWQARYLAELQVGRVTVYPELGAEYQSHGYTNYYFGPRSLEAVGQQRRYEPGAAVNLFAGAMIETRIAQHWYVNLYMRHTVSDDAIADSPLVNRRSRTSALLAAAYRF